jgi:hypothetical protein
MPLRGACGQPLKVHDENVNATEHTEHAKSDLISNCAQAWSFLLFLSGREPEVSNLLLRAREVFLPSPHYKIPPSPASLNASSSLHPPRLLPPTLSYFFNLFQSLKMDPRSNRSCYNCAFFLPSSSSARLSPTAQCQLTSPGISQYGIS